MDKTDNRFYREAGEPAGAWLTFNLTPVQVQALYLHLLRRERPAFGWMEEPLVAIEEALKPAHNAIHDRTFNAMNRQFFGDDRFRLEEAPMPTGIAASQPSELTDEQLKSLFHGAQFKFFQEWAGEVRALMESTK